MTLFLMKKKKKEKFNSHQQKEFMPHSPKHHWEEMNRGAYKR
jgi:hypothetical protein